jgi:2-methylcitrate dehydratase PrpD
MMGTTETLAKYIVDLCYDNIPKPVLEKVKLILLDTIGCGIGGVKTPIGGKAISLANDLMGREEASIFGQKKKTNCLMAGFVNAILVDALDFEETLLCHPGATIIPAALGVGEKINASGKEIITAVVAGYEVATRIGFGIRPSSKVHKEVCVMMSFLAFGSMAAAGKLLNLNEKQLIHAIGYTGASTPLPVWISKWKRPLHWVKNNFGEQARAGIMGALLAEKDFIGPHSMMDHELGFPRMIGTDRSDFDTQTASLGKEYLILNDTFKPYPACRWIHPTLDAILQLTTEKKITPEEIKQINIRTFSEMADWFVDYRPASLVDGQFSIPYTVALILSSIPPGPRWYDKDILEDPNILKLATKVKVTTDEDAELQFYKKRKFLSKIEIKYSENKCVRKTAKYAKGDLENPMTEKEITEKFISLSEPHIGANNSRRLIERLGQLQKEKDVKKITELFTEFNNNE